MESKKKRIRHQKGLDHIDQKDGLGMIKPQSHQLVVEMVFI